MHMNVSVTMINNDAVSAMGSLMLMVHYMFFSLFFRGTMENTSMEMIITAK